MVKDIEANLCFAISWPKFEKSKWPPFLRRGNFLRKLQRVHSLDTLWVENFDEIAISRTVKEIEANLCFAILGKNSKIQNGRQFWGGENFLKIAKVTFFRYPAGRQFQRICSILHGYGDRSKFANLISKLNFYKLIPYPMDNMLNRSAQTGPPNVRKRHPVFPPAGRSVVLCTPQMAPRTSFLSRQPDVIASFSLSKPLRPLVSR